MAKQKTAAELRAENRFLKRAGLAASIASVLRTAIRYGALVWVAYYFYQSIAVLAGKTTFASIVVSFLGSLTVSKALAYAFGTSGVAYGIAERKVRQRTIKRIGKRIEELESRIDPNRSSSDLSDRGEPQPDNER